MKISILDQSPIQSNQTAQDALIQSIKLAQVGEELGYTRYWIAEHHDLPGLACSAPEVMISAIAAQTKQIRVGAGAILLPHYKPYKVAEVFHLLATLFPNRIDIGIGRAPGGSAEVTNALNDNFLQKVYQFPELVRELLHFFATDFPKDHPYEKVKAAPIPRIPPEPWLLGTSEKSAKLAAQHGLAYAFGQFMSDKEGANIIQQYLDTFQPKKPDQKPQVLLTVSAICAETTEKAEEIALSSLIWGLQTEKGEGHHIPSIEEAKQYKLTEKEKEKIEKAKQKMIIGNPQKVRLALQQYQINNHADEIMIVTITGSAEDRMTSYRLIAKELYK